MRRQIPISGLLSTLIARVALDGEPFKLPPLPPVIGGTWGDISLDGLWGPLSIDGPALVWEVNVAWNAGADVDSRDRRIEGLRNQPAVLRLADGTRVSARFGGWRRWGGRADMAPGYTCEFNVWNVEGPRAARWVGKLRGGGFLNGNLGVVAPGTFSAGHMRLQGNYAWHIFRRDKERDVFDVIIDAGASPLEQQALGVDFDALQFSFGTPMQLDTLIALDEPGNIVGCAGVQLGGNRPTKQKGRADGPVPDDVTEECWVPVFFQRLVKAMASDDLPWRLVCNTYLDSVNDATIDGGYLKLQIALEAFGKALLKREDTARGALTKAPPRRLVRDQAQWVAWVKAHGEELRGMVADNENADSFIGKVISAMNLPSSGVVADALARLTPPLAVDETALEELGKRNIPAHHGTMNKPGEAYDVDRDVERVDVLRSLLVALVGRACAYDGAISGWVRGGAAAWKPQPNWWPAPSQATAEEARTSFSCRRGPWRSPRPKVFRSRLHMKKRRSNQDGPSPNAGRSPLRRGRARMD